MKKILFLISIIFLLLFACDRAPKKNHITSFKPKVIFVKGYEVPRKKEDVFLAFKITKPFVVNAGSPGIAKTNTNVHSFKVVDGVFAQPPKVVTPGTGSFAKPWSIRAVEKPGKIGIPEVVIAKDAYTKDQNPQSFSFYGKLQGLKHGNINCIMKDKIGNIWFGTFGGGACKYDGRSFTHFTEKEGLCNNDIWCILEDADANIWFGSWGKGVSKYNGRTFTNYTKKEGLSSDIVLGMLQDKNKNIWFATQDGGVNKFDGKTFTQFTKSQGLCHNHASSILEDRNGDIWFGTYGGVSKYNGKSFENYTTKEGLSNNEVRCLLEDKYGNIWLGTDGGGANKFNGKTFEYYTDKKGLNSNRVWSIAEDKNANIWFGTSAGAAKLEGNKYSSDPGKLKTFTQYSEKEGLSNNEVVSILEDKTGNLWLGTSGGGVNKYNGRSFNHYTKKEGLSNNEIVSMIQDRNGNMWFGTINGVIKYNVSDADTKNKTFSNYTQKEGLSKSEVRCMLENSNGDLWFGTDGNGIMIYNGKTFSHYTEEQGLSNNFIKSLLRDKNGKIWIATNGGGVNIFNGDTFIYVREKEGLSNNEVRCMLEDKNGNIWFGTNRGGITKFNGKTFTQFTEKQGLPNNSIRCMIEDRKGNIWIGTNGSGVLKYDPVMELNTGANAFTQYTEKEGLSNNTVLSALEDRKGNIWFGTRFGISKIKHNAQGLNNKNADQTVLFKNYNYEEGFLGIGCYGNSIYEDKAGTIWIGANDRLTALHPQEEDTDIYPPNIQLTSVKLYNENINWESICTGNSPQNKIKIKDTSIVLGNGVEINGLNFTAISKWYNLPENLSLAYNNNYLTFSFIGVTQKQTKKVKYQYMLEGLDENWSAIIDITEATYGNLPHGTYTFKVRAMNSEGYWSKDLAYSFTIRAPWWQTWWFRILTIVFIVTSFYAFFRWRTNSLRLRQKQLEQTVAERTTEVVHQKDEAEKQKELVEKKQKEITDSINYAKRIQEAILPPMRFVKHCFPDSFILYKPKDIVAGDFYWIETSGDEIIFAAADCTGHGVPGAMVSVICHNALNRTVKEFNITSPSKILDKTRELVIEQFEKSDEEVKDGMDISLCTLNKKTNNLLWAGANNPLWIIRNNELIEYKPDKQPIGKYAETKSFTNHIIQLQKDDCIYVFTDGYADQFGGEEGKKLKAAKMKALLLSIHLKTMEKQKEDIFNLFEEWRGNIEQVDDVCIIGIKI